MNDIQQYKTFLKMLADDPHDQATRMIFADFLEENGMDDEASGVMITLEIIHKKMSLTLKDQKNVK